MKVAIEVENIKCGGCANSIKQKLAAIEGCSHVEVDIENGLVHCDLAGSIDNDLAVAGLKQQLSAMGYPEVGSVEGIKAAGAKAKSFVSCAVGRMSDSSSEDK